MSAVARMQTYRTRKRAGRVVLQVEVDEVPLAAA
jgi:hypothetical protein